MVVVAAFLFLFIWAGSCNAKSHGHGGEAYFFAKNASEAPAISYYDYIVVGGGTAGCPLAATLSKKFDVLVLERGGLPYGNKYTSTAAEFGSAFSDRSSSSPAQVFTSEDGVLSARARVLGGGSSINAGFYSRASSKEVEEMGWDVGLVNESYRWVESKVVFKPVVGGWQSAFNKGLLEVGVKPDNGFTFVHETGTKLGGTIFDSEGYRHPAIDLLSYANRRKLTVLLYATVGKILFDGTTAYGVEFRDEQGKHRRACLNKDSEKREIILSAGALGSPQLLLLSGVGPAKHLKSMNIPVVLDQPMVGQGMADNPMAAVFLPLLQPVDVSMVQAVGITSNGIYIESGSGVNVPSLYSVVVPAEDEVQGVPRNSADDASNRWGFILEKGIGPFSTGHLQLRNRDPDDNPSVTFNYFQDPRDLNRCMEGVFILQKLISSNSLAGFKNPNMTIDTYMNDSARYSFNFNLLHRHYSYDSASLEKYCRDTVMSVWHFHGGCQVGRVVDRDYKVMGIHGLRVIDGSTFSFSPGTNPQATLMMLGRYMGVKMRKERLKKKHAEEQMQMGAEVIMQGVQKQPEELLKITPLAVKM